MNIYSIALSVHETRRLSYGGCASRDLGSFSPLQRLVALAFVCVFVELISLCSPFVTQPAYAVTSPVSTSPLSATVMFHQTYSAGCRSYVHSGIDIPASAGMQISSPLAGTVRFTGSVPSGDSRWDDSVQVQTMNAVSIEVENNRVITLMPFSTIDVTEGQSVSEGMALGILAPSGDCSSSSSHLHLGYKHGRTYLDPMTLFGLTGKSEPAEHSNQSVDVPAQESTPGAYAGEDEIAKQSIAEQGAPAESFGMIESGAFDWKPRTQEAASPFTAFSSGLEPLFSACQEQLDSLVDSINVLSNGIGIPSQTLLAAMFSLVVFALALFVFAGIRLFFSYARKIRDIEIQSLSSGRGGDSMHKLFPAPGTAFMSRGRIARGR
jgi:murein DD-endopeptidase MepM/ murein hydrolase activator NlpD